jgi:taurine dioxygenase
MELSEQIALARRLGQPHIHPLYADEHRPEALRIYADASSQYVAGDSWHSDSSWEARPPSLSILRLDVTPSVGGDTVFASTSAAYSGLSEPMRTFVGQLSAVHSYGSPSHPELTAVHPMVRSHPLTGSRCLFVNPSFTRSVPELSPAEGAAVLRFLFEHSTTSLSYQCRVRWETGTVAIWDNRCTIHSAVWDYFPQRREGWRVAVAGEPPSVTS